MFIRVSKTRWVKVDEHPEVTIVHNADTREHKLQLWWMADGALAVFEEFVFESIDYALAAAAKLSA